jgi:hypothetical protein
MRENYDEKKRMVDYILPKMYVRAVWLLSNGGPVERHLESCA